MEEQSLWKKVSSVVGITIVPIAFVGITGNMLTVFIFTRKSMVCSINTLLTTLAVIDCFLLVVGTPLFSIMSMYDDQRLQIVLKYLTLYAYPLAMMAQTASVWCLVAITLERFIAVIYPLKTRIICTIKNARTVSLLITVSAIAYNFCRFWEYDISDVNNELCHILKSDPLYLSLYAHWMYFFLIFFIPFALLLIFNGLILNELKKAYRNRAALTRQQNRENKFALMTVVVILIFLVCTSLAFVLNAIEATQNEKCHVTNECSNVLPSSASNSTCKNAQENQVEPDPVWCVSNTDIFYLFVDVNNLLIEINSSVNFIVYYAFSQRYRKLVRQLLLLLKRCCRKDATETNGENRNETELRSLLNYPSVVESTQIKTEQQSIFQQPICR